MEETKEFRLNQVFSMAFCLSSIRISTECVLKIFHEFGRLRTFVKIDPGLQIDSVCTDYYMLHL